MQDVWLQQMQLGENMNEKHKQFKEQLDEMSTEVSSIETELIMNGVDENKVKELIDKSVKVGLLTVLVEVYK